MAKAPGIRLAESTRKEPLPPVSVSGTGSTASLDSAGRVSSGPLPPPPARYLPPCAFWVWNPAPFARTVSPFGCTVSACTRLLPTRGREVSVTPGCSVSAGRWRLSICGRTVSVCGCAVSVTTPFERGGKMSKRIWLRRLEGVWGWFGERIRWIRKKRLSRTGVF